MIIIAKVQIKNVLCILTKRCESFSITGDTIEYIFPILIGSFIDPIREETNVANKVSEIEKLWADGVLIIDNYKLV